MTALKPALVFGASGEQGRAVIEGFVDAGYSPVYGFTSNSNAQEYADQYLSDALGCILLQGDLSNPNDVEQALTSTKAQAIFVVTTTDLAGSGVLGSSMVGAMEEEYNVICQWFETLKKVHAQDKLPRTVVLSVRDNVQDLCRTQYQDWIAPLDDGSIVPHYSAKGKGGEQALKLVEGVAGLDLVLVMVPFFYSNFLAFFTPLPNQGRTQWELAACFGDGSTKIDMMNVSDLGVLVPNLIQNSAAYKSKTLRVAAEKISMDEIAGSFSDLFGKDVVYNPLLPEELAVVDFPSAPAMAQMCQFLGDPRSLEHDTVLTAQLMTPRKPTSFQDWLLTHSDSTAFSRVGLDLDAEPIESVCVFGATSAQGKSVIKGLLADLRQTYTIRGTTRKPLDSPEVMELKNLDPERITLVNADFENVLSCQQAVEGMDGAFLVADFWEQAQPDMEEEERHTKNIIDACEGNVKHLVFSTMESVENVNPQMTKKELLEFSPKARAAAYARSKSLSVTFVLMPCYSELFFDMMEKQVDKDGNTKLVLKVPLKDKDAKVMCMSVEELGPAVANIFDSYQCFAGHEIGLVTDFIPVSQVQEIFQDVFSPDQIIETEQVDMKEWVEAKDTYMKDLGQMFASLSHVDFLRHRHSVAKTFSLVPSARNLRQWVEQNKDNPAFREKLGLR